MTAKIVTSLDFGYRKVIRVCLNPDEPKFVHADGSLHPTPGAPARGENGCPHSRDVVTGQENRLVPGCQYNHKIVEYVFEGKWLKATDEELVAEVKRRVALLAPGKTIPGLVGIEV